MDTFNIPDHIKVPKGRRRKCVQNAVHLLQTVSIQRVGSDEVDVQAASLIHECFEYLIQVGYFKDQFEG